MDTVQEANNLKCYITVRILQKCKIKLSKHKNIYTVF